MGNTRLRPDGVVPFVDASQEDVAEVNGPDAVVDLLEADGVLLERVGDDSSRLFRRMVPALVTPRCPCESRGTVLEAIEPLVAGLPTDAVPGAEFDHRIQFEPVIANEPFTLFHG